MSRTFHNLSAGSTTILPSGKVIRFGGKVEQGEGTTKVGTGTYTTSQEDEIAWLESLCKMPSPQVWEEKVEEDVQVPAKVAAGTPADATKTAGEIKERAEVAVNPKVVQLMEKLGKIDNDPNTPAAK